MVSDTLNAYGIGQIDGTSFVFPTQDLDALMERVHGDPRLLEMELGLPEGFFSDYEIVRVDVADPGSYSLRIPSGNEAGASEQWIPGGLLPKGMPEAVIDGGAVPRDGYSVSEMTR